MTENITNKEKSVPRFGGPVHSPADFGQLIRSMRRQQGLTLEEVYSATGLTTRFLSEFERGKSNASLGGALRAAQALGLEVMLIPRSHHRQIRDALAGLDDRPDTCR